MRRVVYREIGSGGPKRRRRRKSSAAKARSNELAGLGGGSGFGQLLSRLFSASSSLDRSRARVGSR